MSSVNPGTVCIGANAKYCIYTATDSKHVYTVTFGKVPLLLIARLLVRAAHPEEISLVHPLPLCHSLDVLPVLLDQDGLALGRQQHEAGILQCHAAGNVGTESTHGVIDGERLQTCLLFSLDALAER